MSVTFPLAEFFQNSGNSAALFAENLRDAIVTQACSLWSSYPKFISENQLPGPSFARGFMNQTCSPLQPPVPFPPPPFLGGQCPGVIYNFYANGIVSADNTFLNLTRGQVVEIRFNNDLTGPIGNIAVDPFVNAATIFADIDEAGGTTNSQAVWDNPLGGFNTVGWLVDQPGNIASGTVWLTTVTPTEVRRKDGQPDTCGDPPTAYPDVQPTQNDLTVIVPITNLDGFNNNVEITFNKSSTNYNFPMNFKVNGINATLDLSGLTIFGSPLITTPTGRDTAPIPGTDGGDDGLGGNNNKPFPDSGWLALPDLVSTESIQQLINYVLCDEGVITEIADTIAVVGANIPFVEILIAILVNILRDVCAINEVEPTLGLPDYYGFKTGVERPALVYLYKEVMGGKWGQSTYTSTVPHPTAMAIANLDSISVPDKMMGTYVTSLSLKDGSKVKVSGDTEANSLTNFNFLLAQIEPLQIPANVANCILTTNYPKLEVKAVKCRQIEYYENGKTAGASPSMRRVINL